MAKANSHIACFMLFLVIASCLYIPTQQTSSCMKDADCRLSCPLGGPCDTSSHLCICKLQGNGSQLSNISKQETIPLLDSADKTEEVTVTQKPTCSRDVDCFFKCPSGKGGFCNNGICDCNQ